MILLVTNICPHYRVRVFEILARSLDIRFLFFSDPSALRNWERRNPVVLGRFAGEVLRPVRLGPLRLVPELYRHLLTDEYDVLVKCINGKAPVLLSFLIARIRGIPFVLWTELGEHPGTLLHRLSFPIVRAIYRRSAAIVAGGTHVRAYLEGLGVDPAKIFVAVQSVDHTVMGRRIPEELRAVTRARFGSGGRKIVLFAGRMEPAKGIAVLIEAMATLCAAMPVSLIAVGEGSEKERLREACARIPGLDLHLTGYVPNDELPVLYRSADVFVAPSLVEVWGLVLNEALHQGCPVVTTRVAGAVRGGLVQDGVNGLVVEEGSARALESALRRVLTDDALRSRLSAGALRTIASWTQERKAAGFLDAIARARASRQRPRERRAG